MWLMALVRLSVKRPRSVLAAAALVTAAFGASLPAMTLDANPKNTLPRDAEVRVWNREVDALFSLRESTIVVGVERRDGLFTTSTLAKIGDLTKAIQEVPGIASEDVTSLATVMHLGVERDELRIAPLVAELPRTPEALARLRATVRATPALLDRLVSRDETITAIYAPLLDGADARVAVDRVRALVAAAAGPEELYVTGDPVIQETFGAQMFVAVGVLGPLSGFLMLGIAFFMFRRASMAFAVMGTATLVIVWSIGFIVALGHPVHIMSSMAPVFLMAIATDSIHIFNELASRERTEPDRARAIVATMEAVRRPLLFTDLTTALAFAMLLTSSFGPIQVFGLCVAFGTMALLVVSFSVVPALLALSRPSRAAVSPASAPDGVSGQLLRRVAWVGVRYPRATLLASLALVAASAIGMAKIRVNNNQLDWFEPGSEIRRADRVMNQALGGTALGYVVVDGGAEGSLTSPAALRAVEALQRELETLPHVGKTHSIVDQLKTAHRALNGDDPGHFALPGERDLIAQYLFLLGTSGRPADVQNVLDGSSRHANVWVQMRTWDASAMRDVAAVIERFEGREGLRLRPAGTAYLNMVWNDLVLVDMLHGFAWALVAVLVVLALNFRSLKWALVSYVPLLLTIALLYGALGFAGKDFDMPICVLSTLSLGMAVDFAIHFIERFRRAYEERTRAAVERGGGTPDRASVVREAVLWTAVRPGRGILRNAVLFAGTFSVMFFASLTPYVTVGAFMVTMMLLSALLTLLLLPAIIVLLERAR
jgi:predicted RND superfamily exporter protein